MYARSSRLQQRGEVGVCRPGADHDAEARRPRRSIASTVSAVWLSVPRPARATTISGASSSSATSAIVALVAEAHEQPAGALDEHEARPSRCSTKPRRSPAA